MPRQTTLLTYLNTVAGPLPKGAITEWLEAAAPASVTIEEDACGNIVGEPMGNEIFRADRPEAVFRRTVHSSYGERITNWQWCQMEMERHNAKNPSSPIYVYRSKKSHAYVCLAKVRTDKGEEA